MKKITLAFIAFLITTSLYSQSNEKWSLGFANDLIKSKTQGTLDHFQVGLEVNYQIIKPIALTSGFEYWGPAPGLGMVAGARYYPHKNIFIRARKIFFIRSAAVGAGWKKSIGKQWNIEAMADYYHEETVALRVGLSRTF